VEAEEEEEEVGEEEEGLECGSLELLFGRKTWEGF
jgi:hypothetical protein